MSCINCKTAWDTLATERSDKYKLNEHHNQMLTQLRIQVDRWRHAYETAVHDDCCCSVNANKEVSIDCKVHEGLLRLGPSFGFKKVIEDDIQESQPQPTWNESGII